MNEWIQFSSETLPKWNTIIEIMKKDEPQTVKKVFYGSEDSKNLDKSVDNINKSGMVGIKLLWRNLNIQIG